MKSRKKQRSGGETGRKLLVAAAGVASISYVGALQGCVGQVDPAGGTAEGEPKAIDWSDGGVAGESTDKALVFGHNVTSFKPVQPVGNLMPPGGEGFVPREVEDIRVPIPVGNLMVTPVDQLQVEDFDQAVFQHAEKVIR